MEARAIHSISAQGRGAIWFATARDVRATADRYMYTDTHAESRRKFGRGWEPQERRVDTSWRQRGLPGTRVAACLLEVFDWQ